MPERRRVLIVSTALTGGGAERFTSTLLRHLDRGRFEPVLALLRPEVTYPLPTDVPLHVLDDRGKRTLLRTMWRLRRLLRRVRPDVVVSSLSYTSLFVGEALGRAGAGARWVARFGAPPQLQVTDWRSRLFDLWLRRVYPRAACYVANSHVLAGQVARFYPFTTGRLRVIYNPADFAAIDRLTPERQGLPPPPGVPVVVSTTRLSPEKRPDLLLEAFARLRRRVASELWVCGDGPGRPQFEADVRRRDLAGCVRLLGFRDNPYAPMALAAAFVLTSDFEGLPNALIEAQGMGLPAVATHTEGVSGSGEVIEEGRTGFLVAVGDAEALADRLGRLLLDPKLRAAMGAAARERARRVFDLRAVMPDWEALLG